jgi:hypothetical protein
VSVECGAGQNSPRSRRAEDSSDRTAFSAASMILLLRQCSAFVTTVWTVNHYALFYFTQESGRLGELAKHILSMIYDERIHHVRLRFS